MHNTSKDYIVIKSDLCAPVMSTNISSYFHGQVHLSTSEDINSVHRGETIKSHGEGHITHDSESSPFSSVKYGRLIMWPLFPPQDHH